MKPPVAFFGLFLTLLGLAAWTNHVTATNCTNTTDKTYADCNR